MIKDKIIKTNQIKTSDEKTLLSGVIEITEDANFRETTLESLGGIKKIGGSIYLDASSSLKDLSSLKEVGRKIVVSGRSKDQIEKFLKNAKFSFETLGKQVVTILRYY